MLIMIIDDNEDEREIMQAILTTEGFEVVVAADAAEALRLAEDMTPDLFISDLRMPVMNGFELCSKIREDDRFRVTPFFFHSAQYFDSSEEALAQEIGVSGFLRKPGNIPEIIATIRKALNETD